MKKKRPSTFLRARAGVTMPILALVVVDDDYEEFQKMSHLVTYAPNEIDSEKWGSWAFDFWLMGVSIARFANADRKMWCGISAEGDVFFTPPRKSEKILGAGIESPDSKFCGRMKNIRGIGNSLFACGDGGQIYQRLPTGQWRNIAPELLNGQAEPAEYDMFSGINGPNENDVYVAGRFGKIFHWNGERVSKIPSPTDNWLVYIYVESEQKIWISGAESSLLLGNHKDGFKQVPGIDDLHHFNSLTMYEGKLYLASSLYETAGLYAYENGRLKKVDTGLKPEIDEVNYVDAGAGVLWAVGGKDIIFFDGMKWQRVDFPYNDPIR